MKDYAPIVIALAVIIVSIVILIIVLIFRTELRDFMRRLVKVGPQGAEATPPTQQQSITIAAERAPQQSLSQNPAPHDPGIVPWQQEIETIIDRENLRANPALVDQLKHALAHTKRLLDFHTVARVIYGTQIATLRLLASNANGLTLDDQRPIFHEHEARLAVAGVDFKPDILPWLNFLVTQRLVTYQNGHYKISPAGSDFLAFLGNLGINEMKAF